MATELASFNPRARAGRDSCHVGIAIPDDGFNPRARAGRDISRWITTVVDFVSIHAPARGATWKTLRRSTIRNCFNPRARAGRDHTGSTLHHCFLCFNPRARAGRDQRAEDKGIPLYCFNPRARAGRDTDFIT